MILFAENVAQHDHIFAFLNKSHGNSGYRLLDWYSGIHEGKRSTAHCCHGRGAIGLQNFGNNAHGIRKIRLSRQDGLEGTLREMSVADFPASRSKTTGFSDGVRRKVVMQHEVCAPVPLDTVEDLFIEDRAERGNRQCLCFTSSKKRRPVSSGKRPYLAGDWPDVLRTTAIRPYLLFNDGFSHNLLFKFFHEAGEESLVFVRD